MAARIKLFFDENCTKELYRNDKGQIFCRYFKILEDGTIKTYIDGIEGGRDNIILYLKNIGTRAALQTKLLLKERTGEQILYNTVIEIGDIAVDEVKKVELTFGVTPWSAAQINKLLLFLEYYSLPDITSESNSYMFGQEYVKETDLLYRKSTAG